jgi:hypothetical protein
MNRLHGEYAQYYNRDMGRLGHVFGQRFNNKVVQINAYGLWLSRYIHRQAVEAGLVTDPKEYQWCSYRAYLGELPLSFLKPGVILEQFGSGRESFRRYEKFVLGTEKDPVDWDSKSATVIGDDTFKKNVQKRRVTGDQEQFSDKELFILITERFNVKPELLMTARGLQEKLLRRQIITYLIEEVGLKTARGARLCRISCMAVQKALRMKV